ncbi:MAG TPA: glycosyltransferase family 2 protein [Burkholderiales bacterium]|nr:glycosyltransferase family 2 protein [Burkholderiales bacterium]
MTDQGEARPTISIIVATFNRGKTLQRCIDSVAGQTYGPRELVVIDGGSTDGSVDIIRANHAKIAAWRSEPDRGIYHAWNKGVTLAKGEWVAFLGADDYLHDAYALEKMSVHLAVAAGCPRIVYGRVIVVDASGTELARLGGPWASARRSFLHGTACLPTPGVMFHRELFGRHGLFDEAFSIAGDYEFLLRELKYGEARYVADIVVTNMQYGGISSRPESTLVSLREMRAARLKHGLPALNVRYVAALLGVRLRLVLWRVAGERAARRILDWGRQLLGKPPFWTKVKA